MAERQAFKYAIISDVHANLEALKAVLSDIEKRGIENIIFLGDAVGYGPEPDETVRLLKEHCMVLLAGNHDWATIGYTPTYYFNEAARIAIDWTKDKISEETFETLKDFQIIKVLRDDDIFCVHSTPKDPDAWNYLLTLEDAEINFHYFEERFCFLGHSHRP
ncbi:MAG: metallophosphoesterase, partial [Nitrospirae bacterium]